MEKENKRVLKTFSASAFLNDMGSEMLRPVWPFFVTNVLGASAQFLGFVDGLGDAVVALSQVVSGYFSDRLRKKKVFIWAGYALSAIGRFGYFIARTPAALVPSKILDRAGKMRDAPRDVLLAEAVTHRFRGRAFGVLRASDNAGSVAGIILALILIQFFSLRTIIFLSIFPSIVATILIILFIRRRKEDEIRIFQGLRFSDLNKNLVLFLITIGIFTLSTFSFSFLLLAADKFGLNVVWAPLLFFIFTLVTAFLAIPFGKLSDKIGRKKVIALSFVFWILTAGGFLFFVNKALIVLMFVLYGVHRGAFEPVFKTFVTELAPAHIRASTIGIFQLVIGILAFPASFIAGTLWQRIGFQAPFIFSAFLAIVALVFLSLVKERANDF